MLLGGVVINYAKSRKSRGQRGAMVGGATDQLLLFKKCWGSDQKCSSPRLILDEILNFIDTFTYLN